MNMSNFASLFNTWNDAYLYLYLQISDQYYNTNLVDVRVQTVDYFRVKKEHFLLTVIICGDKSQLVKQLTIKKRQ